jgi:hypothetical protein
MTYLNPDFYKRHFGKTKRKRPEVLAGDGQAGNTAGPTLWSEQCVPLGWLPILERPFER